MGIHATALVDPGARLGAGVAVGPFAVVEDDVELGDRCQLRAHSVVKSGSRLGTDNTVYEGAILGGEPQDLGFAGGATRLVIGNGNLIREGATLHRSATSGGVTRVGSECFIMAYVHIAHDCHLGDRVILANNVTMAGHVEVGDRAFLSGLVGVHQFCRVGRLAMVGGNSKVVKDCLPFVITDGFPARARGLNLVGLRRAGLGGGQLKALKRAYRLLLRSSLPLAAALEQMAALQDPLVDEMVAFVRGSRRGFHRSGRGGAEAE